MSEGCSSATFSTGESAFVGAVDGCADVDANELAAVERGRVLSICVELAILDCWTVD